MPPKTRTRTNAVLQQSSEESEAIIFEKMINKNGSKPSVELNNRRTTRSNSKNVQSKFKNSNLNNENGILDLKDDNGDESNNSVSNEFQEKENSEINFSRISERFQKNQSDLQSKKSDPSQASLNCPNCKKVFARKRHLQRHLQSTSCSSQSSSPINTEKLFHCSQCEKSFTRQDNLRNHEKKHLPVNEQNRDKKYKCVECGKMFYTPSHLLIHSRIHSGERPFQCQECGKSFTNSGALKKHGRIHTGEKPFQCQECSLSFSLKGTLNRHMKIHTGVKPHKCEFCGKEFIQSGGLKAHLFFHTGKNGFKCDQCNRIFNRKARLDMHKKYVHEKIKPHLCSSCGKSFTRKEDLNRHLILHTGLKNHQCTKCKKRFAIKTSLNVHLLVHQKEEHQWCQVCNHTFLRKDCLVRHIRKVHRAQADVLLQQHGLIPYQKDQDLVIDKENDIDLSNQYELINGKLNDEKLCEAIRELLIYIVDANLLKGFGWPNKPVDVLLESLIRQCNYQPAKQEDFSFFDRLRENIKLFFTVVIEDESLKETLDNKTVDELIVDVIQQAKAA